MSVATCCISLRSVSSASSAATSARGASLRRSAAAASTMDLQMAPDLMGLEPTPDGVQHGCLWRHIAGAH